MMSEVKGNGYGNDSAIARIFCKIWRGRGNKNLATLSRRGVKCFMTLKNAEKNIDFVDIQRVKRELGESPGQLTERMRETNSTQYR